MELIDDRLLPRSAFPAAILPAKAPRVDHLARSMDIVGLEARGRVRDAPVFIDTKAIVAAGSGPVGYKLKPAPLKRRHRQDHIPKTEVNLIGRGCPEPKPHPAIGPHLCPEGHTMPLLHRFSAAMRRASARPCNG